MSDSEIPSDDFWRGKRVLLTGHTGFKGAWAALWLARMGADITGFALPPETQPSFFELTSVGADIRSIMGDLRDSSSVQSAVDAARPEIVLHMAAQPIVRRAIADPIETFASNIMGTANLLEALRKSETVRSIIVITSDKVYANADDGHAHKEGDALGGKDPYSASKAACEMVARSYAQTYFVQRGIRLVTARGGNVIGGGDYSEDRIVPDIIRAALKKEKPLLRMPWATRPWQHVLDCLSGYLLFAQAVHNGAAVPSTLNFGPDAAAPITVETLTEALLAGLHRPVAYRTEAEPGSVEMATLSIDATLARTLLNWRDRLSGERIVQWTADWYSRVHAGHDARETSLAQISAYCTL